MPSCRGAICHVADSLEKPESLGHMTDFIYDHTMDRIKVDFKEVQSSFDYSVHIINT